MEVTIENKYVSELKNLLFEIHNQIRYDLFHSEEGIEQLKRVVFRKTSKKETAKDISSFIDKACEDVEDFVFLCTMNTVETSLVVQEKIRRILSCITEEDEKRLDPEDIAAINELKELTRI